MLNVPNTLTLLRIAAIPVILISLEQGHFDVAFAVFIIAGVTDGLDGGIARMTNSRTTLGAYLDPLADKGLVLSLLIQLTVLGKVPSWVLTIILTRDVVCMTGYAVLYFLTNEAIEIQPSLIGKLATCLQLAGLAATLFILAQVSRLEGPAGNLVSILYIGAAATTAISGVQYVARGLKWYQSHPGGAGSAAV